MLCPNTRGISRERVRTACYANHVDVLVPVWSVMWSPLHLTWPHSTTYPLYSPNQSSEHNRAQNLDWFGIQPWISAPLTGILGKTPPHSIELYPSISYLALSQNLITFISIEHVSRLLCLWSPSLGWSECRLNQSSLCCRRYRMVERS